MCVCVSESVYGCGEGNLLSCANLSVTDDHHSTPKRGCFVLAIYEILFVECEKLSETN